ncbi:hypothetical protein Tco_1074297 [Tanacetum coccineum]
MLKQSNLFAEAISSISGIVDKYLATKMKEGVDVAVELKSDKLKEEAQAENQDFIHSLESNMTKIIKEHVKGQTSKIMSKVEKYVTETLGAEVLVRSTNQPQTSYTAASSLSELEGHGDEDKDEEPSAGSNRGTKRRRSDKETESTNEPTHKESRTTSSSRGGPKRQRFYGYATNMETSKDVYSKHRIIAVISLKIMKFYGYSHLEEIIVRQQDDKLDKFREGDFKRLRRQDIKEMLLLLVQGKLTNLRRHEQKSSDVPLMNFTSLGDGHTKSFRYYTPTIIATRVFRWSTSERDDGLIKQRRARYDESNTYVLERLNTTAGNPVKEILPNLNLPDHRSILTVSKEQIKMEMEVSGSS